MPRSKKRVYRLYAAFIEQAHDIGINLVWPGIEPVKTSSCLEINLLMSAAEQPYQECFGCELYPSLAAKAAYLFCHLASGHVFSNGNKRTAALCLDLFLTANTGYLTLSNQEIETLAQFVASAGERQESFAAMMPKVVSLIEQNIIPVSSFRTTNPRVYRMLHKAKHTIRRSPTNQANVPLAQRK